MVSLGPIECDANRVETLRLNASFGVGGPNPCGCENCQRFLGVASVALPGEFLGFLRSCGVDALKPIELGYLGVVDSRHVYEGEYLIACSSFPKIDYYKSPHGFEYRITHASPSVPSKLKQECGLYCVAFSGPVVVSD